MFMVSSECFMAEEQRGQGEVTCVYGIEADVLRSRSRSMTMRLCSSSRLHVCTNAIVSHRQIP